MLAIIAVSLLLIVGVGRVQPALLAVLCTVAFIVCDPALLQAAPLAFLATFAFLFVSIRWLYPAVLDGVQPGRWVWVTPRLVVAVAYA